MPEAGARSLHSNDTFCQSIRFGKLASTPWRFVPAPGIATERARPGDKPVSLHVRKPCVIGSVAGLDTGL